MGVAHPWESTGNRDGDGEIRSNTGNEDRIMCVLVVDEDEGDTEDEPYEAGRRAARVNTSQMLQRRRTCEPESERRPLHRSSVVRGHTGVYKDRPWQSTY